LLIANYTSTLAWLDINLTPFLNCSEKNVLAMPKHQMKLSSTIASLFSRMPNYKLLLFLLFLLNNEERTLRTLRLDLAIWMTICACLGLLKQH
jgi:hypothetical protein